jgi:hypothetical protein
VAEHADAIEVEHPAERARPALAVQADESVEHVTRVGI